MWTLTRTLCLSSKRVRLSPERGVSKSKKGVSPVGVLNTHRSKAIIIKFLVSQVIFQPKPCARALFKIYFSNLWHLYHPFLLVQWGLHLCLLSLPTCGLVLPQRWSLPVLVSDIRSALQLPWKRMDRARSTNLSFEKVVSWQDIRLENYVKYGPEDAKTPPKNVVVSLQKRQNQHCFRPVVWTLSMVASWFKRHRTVAYFITNKTLHPLGPTRDWTEQPDHNKSWHVTLATEKCTCSGEKTVTWPLLKNWHAGGNWHARLPEKQWYLLWWRQN